MDEKLTLAIDRDLSAFPTPIIRTTDIKSSANFISSFSNASIGAFQTAGINEVMSSTGSNGGFYASGAGSLLYAPNNTATGLVTQLPAIVIGRQTAIYDMEIYKENPGNTRFSLATAGSTASFLLKTVSTVSDSGLSKIVSVGNNYLNIFNANTDRYLRVFAGGNVGISIRANVGFDGYTGLNTTTPAYLLHLAADSAAKPNGGSWTNSSDSRLKEDIQMADIKQCYSNIKKIPLRRYKWRSSQFDMHRLGFIAQELKEYFPKDVLTSDEYLAINNDQILMSNIGTVKELMRRIEVIEKRIAALKPEELIALKNKIGNINV